MTEPDARRLQAALFELGRRALADHRLLAESQRARREFFGDDGERSAVQEQRFLEWFLLERESVLLATVPIEVLAREGDEEALLGSMAGVFAIESAHDRGVDARDLQEDEALDLLAPAGTFVAGDLVVGRVYGGGRGRWQPSAAVAVYRPGAGIAAAFAKDLARLGLDRRLSQLELEHLLLMRKDAAVPAAAAAATPSTATHRPIEHLEAELDTILAAGGAKGMATEISDALLEAERPGTVLGPLLDQLAFDTTVDLEQARRALMELWSAHHAGDLAPTPTPPVDAAESTGPPGETLGERLVRRLEQGLQQKQDIGELFRQLEEMAGIDPDEDEESLLGDAADDDGDADADADDGDDHSGRARLAPDDPGPGEAGDLEPLVTEFVWETKAAGSDDERLLRLWVGLQQNAPLPHVDLEQITGQDLMRLLLHIYLRAEPAGRATAVRAAFASVQRFSDWAEATQELSLQAAIQGCHGTLVEHLDRLQDAGLRLSGAGDPSARPALLRVEEVARDGFGLRSDDGSHWIAAAAGTSALLRAGDLMLASLRSGDRGDRLQGPVVVLPGDADALIG